jgi:DNA mismatch repair protein MutS
MTKVTPVREQYLQIKAQHPDAIVFFRLGDFYETFDEDAQTAARELDLVLTSRPVAKNQRVPMAGVPHHAIEGYIARLIDKGYRVAIAEQVGEVTGKGLVDREVTRVVTPGTVVEPALLDEKRPNYLAAVVTENDRAGLAYADITTGEFATTQLDAEAVAQELARLQPRECLISDGADAQSPVSSLQSLSAMHITPLPPYRFELGAARQLLLDHFEVTTLDGFGCAGKPLAIQAAGAVLHYLRETQKGALAQIVSLSTYSTERFMTLDASTRRNLELVETIRTHKARGSLLGVLDLTLTPMGGRLLRTRLAQPLLDRAALEVRLDEVQTFYDDTILRGRVRETLKGLPDLERLTNRVMAGIATPRDLVGIRRALEAVPQLLEEMQEAGSKTQEDTASCILRLASSIDPCEDVAALIASAIADEPPASPSAGGVIRRGFSDELDAIVTAAQDAKSYVAGLEAQERERTGIKTLKVGYNKVFGYYIEVTKANIDAVPETYIRKQTLVNSERYITPELKEYEALILNAEERQAEVETRLFKEVCQQAGARGMALLNTARGMAQLDVASALAEVAIHNRYVRPELTDDDALEIEDGRHPVVEKALRDEPFTPNDLGLNGEERILVITGPNMAGKCLAENTLVSTDRGLLPIGSLRPAETRADTFAETKALVHGLEGRTLTSHFYDGGRASVLRVRTRLGYEIVGTHDHRLWARRTDGMEGWVRLADLTLEDFVALKPGVELWGTLTDLDNIPFCHVRGAKRYRLPKRLTPDLAYLLGLLVGDGNTTVKGRVRLTTGESFLAEEFCRIVAALFEYKPYAVSKRGTKAREYVVTSRDIQEYLIGLGLDSVLAHEKTVPWVILQSPREMVVAFLQGLFDADASADQRYGGIEYSTSSEVLARQVHLLLLNLGIVSSLAKRETAVRLSYRVSVYGADAVRFYREVGFRLPRKQVRQTLTTETRHPNIGGVPYMTSLLKQIQARIVEARDKPVALKRVKDVNSIFYTYLPNERNPSYDKLQELSDYCHENKVPCAELDNILDRRYFYDSVVEVESEEARQVCDLSVPQGNAYVADGFVSHNSVYLRQNALIVLMAQIGSFVPADSARIGIVDRIFTRIGAQDEVSAGQSTFMVEMVEAANILNHATPRSLLILDEIGRGTSTYDGMSIAWAMVEYIHNHPQRRSRTLFATHYHELTELADRLPAVRNYNLGVVEEGDHVVFLHKVEPGGADRSYGIHVAQMAGVPKPVIHRAEEMLEQLESGEFRPGTPAPEPSQPALFATEHPAVEELRALDVSQMTPLEAINALYELQRKAKEE